MALTDPRRDMIKIEKKAVHDSEKQVKQVAPAMKKSEKPQTSQAWHPYN